MWKLSNDDGCVIVARATDDLVNVSESTACRYIRKVATAIVRLRP